MKVLILHASVGAGHKRAAEALGRVFAQEDPGGAVVVRDILDFTNRLFRQAYGKGYLKLIKQAPELWGFMFARSDREALQPSRKTLRAFVNEVNAREFRGFFREQAPDAVVCTHFMPLELLSRSAQKDGVPLHCVVTDFAVHALWILPHVRRYYVATEEAYRHLVRKGQAEDRVLCTGIPVDPVFSRSQDAAGARKVLGIDTRLPTVLLLSGGYGVGPTLDLIRSFRELRAGAQLLVVAGANARLEAEAREAAAGLSIPSRVFGFVTNMHELMDASDVVISKPGGLTTSEVLVKGKAMIVIDPIPGQEQRNCEFLLEQGAALRLHEPEDAPYKVRLLLDDPARLAAIRRNAAALGRPNAARDIVRDVLTGAK